MEEVKSKDPAQKHHHHHHKEQNAPENTDKVVPPVQEKPLPSFFETEDLIAEIILKNEKPVIVVKKNGFQTRRNLPHMGHPSGRSDGERRLTKRPTAPIPIISLVPSSATPSMKTKTPRHRPIHEHHEKGGKKLAEVRDRFKVAFEKQEGKKITEALADLDKDIRHYEKTLYVVEKRKVALLYHIKYLTKVLRKNRLQARHAVSLRKSIEGLIKDTMHSQQAIAKQAGIVSVGVRTQLVQMKDLLWAKLGMREYKPEPLPKIPESSPGDKKGRHHHGGHHSPHHHHGHHHHHNPDGDPFHAEGHPELARMEYVQRLLDPTNFTQIIDKPAGLLAAQQYLINYLKQCADIYEWMKDMKITYPTQLGFRREAIKNLPYFNVDTAALFAGLRPMEDPLKVLHEQFPEQSFVNDLPDPNADIKALAAMFQAEPLSARLPEEPEPGNLMQKILHLDIAAKLQKHQHDASLMSFEDYAAAHMPLVNFVVEPAPAPAPEVKITEPEQTEAAGEPAKPMTYEERYPLRSPKPESPSKGRDRDVEEAKTNSDGGKGTSKSPDLRPRSPQDLATKAERPHTAEPNRMKSPVR